MAISGRQSRFRRECPVIRLGTARLPRRFAPRNDTSGEREVHQRPPTVELLPTRRSLSAATGPVGGGCHFNGSLCESFVQCREGHAPPLQWRVPRNGGWYGTAVPSRDCTPRALPRASRSGRHGRFAPRNDTSGEREVHQRPPTVELLPTGRSLSAATGPVGGGCHFNDSLCESFVQHREGHAPPLQSTAGGLLIIHSSFFSLQYSFFYICPPCNGVCMFRLKQNPLRGSRRGSLFIAAWRGLRPYPAGGWNRR